LWDALPLLPDNLMPAESLIAYCRPGFEGECAQEIADKARAKSLAGEVRADRLSGFVEYRFKQDSRASEIGAENPLDVRSLIFARQSLLAFAHLERLPRTDRLTPIMAALSARDERYSDAWAEAPDTDEGKALAPFCKSFGNALISGLKRARLLDPAAPRRLHAFFPQSDNVYLAVADPALSSHWPQGIPRLKFPREAPSRSTLKLDEAFLLLLDEGERTRWLKPGMSAVDLGAAPGGWTWQFVQRSMRVTAVDNGPMARGLLDSGLVTHACEDGFRFRPKKPVDWLVCDMVEQPRRVAELIARWFAQGWCRRAIFNLKLPMKKRYEETQRCLDTVRAAAGDVRAKHLYHDREEITAFAQIR
jgi:23S rRNA (cytidine2498-2'-O)-methyltransferase